MLIYNSVMVCLTDNADVATKTTQCNKKTNFKYMATSNAPLCSSNNKFYVHIIPNLQYSTIERVKNVLFVQSQKW